MPAESARIEELRRRLDADPASVCFATLAEEYRRAGRYDEAIATCRAGLVRHPDYVSARVTLGRALLDTGALEPARAELSQVVRAAPGNLAAIRGLADIHERIGGPPEPGEPGDPAPAVPAAAAPGAPPAPAVDEPAVSALESFLASVRRVRSEIQRPDDRS